MGMRRKQQAILLQHQPQCLIESKLKCKCNASIFARFHLQDKQRTSIPLATRECVRACVFMDKCAYLFVCQVGNERRQLGD